MQNTMNPSSVPCHPRIKRILSSYQQSAEYSLKGPTADVGSRVTVSNTVSDGGRKAAINGQKQNSDSRSFDDAVSVVPTKIARRERDSSASGFRPSETSATVARPLMLIADARANMSDLDETVLEGRTIACFSVSGERRLCMPQVLKSVLDNLPKNQIQEMSNSLNINFAECSSAQLDSLKLKGILPAHISRCGLITQTDAERLCAVLLHSRPEGRHARVGDVRIPVSHECFGGCKGVLLPREYTSPSSLCIECSECSGRLSTAKFVSHSHCAQEDRICHWGFDSSNWRFYLMLAEDVTRMTDMSKLRKMLDDVKALFVSSECSEKTTGNVKLVKGQQLVGSTSQSENLVPDQSDVTVGKWKPDNVYKTYAACLNVVQRLKHAQHENSSSSTLPPYLYTGVPVLENPERVVPFEEEDRYDRNFAPNVSLSLEPFGELRKLREEMEAEEDAKVLTGIESVSTGAVTRNIPSSSSMWQRRRSTHSSTDNHKNSFDESADYDSDTESVSSDKLDLEDECLAEPEVAPKTLLPIDLEHQLAYVKSAVVESSHLDQSTKQNLIEQFSLSQDRHVQVIKSVAGNQKALERALTEVWSLQEAQRQEAANARKLYEEEVARLRQEAAARMREAALERHHLLQQIEALSGTNASSEQAVIAAQYKNEAELWKTRLIETETVNKRLQEEVDELRAAVLRQRQQPKIWKLTTAAAPTSLTSVCSGAPTTIAVLLTDNVNRGDRDAALITPPQSS